MTTAPPTVSPVVSAARFWVRCDTWATGLGFSKLAGFTTEVEFQEYSYTNRNSNVHTKQFGRPLPPSVTLERGLDAPGYKKFFDWHTQARKNDPQAKLPALFTIMSASGHPALSCVLENAWCSKLDIDPAEAGGSAVVRMRVTIVCDGIHLS
ncbi:hypothetical protein ALI144C_19615 [Actinosynnema sp. ALI-1.44]|uniref:phage tail protein n=1 Tax=Actinosynnema sp. ALI-1.44 TaxID=1933779 RepID=UPI00097C49C8|nr:phage tail protein [Actinosynnema sp. ALI-1.44]ONI81524.1 hypothetical protein ALI144C_19615 [Actinosynnema sp. ALI-1.44]